jgi:hypothetical protein
VEIFKKEIGTLCRLYKQAEKQKEEGCRVVSTDEKTGIQALERKNKDVEMKSGKTTLREYEYIRHGTVSLIAGRDVVNGKIVSHMMRETRNEQDFLEFVQNTVSTDEKKKWIFVADQLNTHVSASLVNWVAKEEKYVGDLGEKGKEGILKNKKSRRQFLEDEKHKIRFMYTPKHCSWMNQIEVWFGQLQSQVIRRGDFTSREDLKNKIENYINYYDKCLAKPYTWKYSGKICHVFNA